MRLVTVMSFLFLVTISYSSMCWKKTITRGVGIIPHVCEPDQDKDGLLCYPKCKEGYTGVAFNCPPGFPDDGSFCRKPAPYGRGAGFPWKFGDPLNDSKMFERCRKANPGNPCEKWGAVVYPKCKQGFHNVDCCLCSPNCLWGMADMGVSCTKMSYTRPTHSAGCGDKQYDAGLCYPLCPKDFYNVGPVCWKGCSGKHPIDCGMACASSSRACFDGIFQMVTSVLDVVVKIVETVATGGGSAAVNSAKLSIQTALKTLGEMSRHELKKKIKDAAKEVGKQLSENTLNALADAYLTGEFDWASLDPTGIASVVKAYSHSICY